MDTLTAGLLNAKEGDPSAFAEVVREMYPTIRRFCAHLIGNDGADDATQETFFAAWRALSTFRGDSTARTWLFVIARRSAERVSRRQQVWRDRAGASPQPRPVAGPEASIELHDLLDRLTPERRLALVLTQVVGLTYEEAAEVCQCPVGTIRSRVARARGDLVATDTGADAARRKIGEL